MGRRTERTYGFGTFLDVVLEVRAFTKEVRVRVSGQVKDKIRVELCVFHDLFALSRLRRHALVVRVDGHHEVICSHSGRRSERDRLKRNVRQAKLRVIIEGNTREIEDLKQVANIFGSRIGGCQIWDHTLIDINVEIAI